jgi:hypothetical protein
VLLGRRWRLPPGVPAVLVAVPAVAMHLMFLTEQPWWPALTVAAAAAGAEVVLRVAARFVRLPREAGWAALGLIAPPLVWGTLFVAGEVRVGIGWNVHIVSGLLTLTAFTGVGTVLVTRNLRPPPPASPHAPPGDAAGSAAGGPADAAASGPASAQAGAASGWPGR